MALSPEHIFFNELRQPNTAKEGAGSSRVYKEKEALQSGSSWVAAGLAAKKEDITN